jgi:hypothetical protein
MIRILIAVLLNSVRTLIRRQCLLGTRLLREGGHASAQLKLRKCKQKEQRLPGKQVTEESRETSELRMVQMPGNKAQIDVWGLGATIWGWNQGPDHLCSWLQRPLETGTILASKYLSGLIALPNLNVARSAISHGTRTWTHLLNALFSQVCGSANIMSPARCITMLIEFYFAWRNISKNIALCLKRSSCEPNLLTRFACYIVTDLINALPGNISVNTVQDAKIYGAVFSMSSGPSSGGTTGLCYLFLGNGSVNTFPRIGPYYGNGDVIDNRDTVFCGVCA